MAATDTTENTGLARAQEGREGGTEPGTDLTYFYGIVRGGLSPELGASLTVDGETGLRGVRHLGLTALVSSAKRERYRLSRRHMLGHESVVEAAMASHDVLPARFGIVLPEEKIVGELLAPHYDQLLATFERVTGRIEVGVKISWNDLQAVIGGIVALDPVLQAARKRLTNRTPQRVRLSIGRRVEEALATARERESRRAVETLTEAGHSDEVVVGEAINENMILNASFLVRKQSADAFADAVSALDVATADRYTIQIISPLPPYSFVSFEREEKQPAGRSS